MTAMIGNIEGLMTLGQLINFLERVTDKTKIVITTGGTYVSGFSSYRGYYEELAIVPSGEYGNKSLTVAEFLTEAKAAEGGTFTGWKGGEYKMERENGLWLAFNGECPGIGIKKAKETDYHVVLYGKTTSDC